MPGILAKSVLVAVALLAAMHADARSHRRRPSKQIEHAPPVAIDKRDSVVADPGPLDGRPYWLALAQCGGIYFKLNTLYTDAAVHARVVRPNPHANAEFTRKLNEAIGVATTYFDAATRFLMTDRGIERNDAVLTYDGPSRAAGQGIKSIDAALTAAKRCPRLYRTCRKAYPRSCRERLAPIN